MSQDTKSNLRGSVPGPYTLTSVQANESARETKSITTPKESCNCIVIENILLFHSTRRPPEAPFDGTQTK
jgi:hypothetical protein